MILFGAIAISVRPYSREASNRILAAVIAIGPLLVALPYFLYRARIWRQWRRKTGVFSPVETTIAEDGIQSKSQGVSSHIAWDAFTGFRRSDRMAVLYLKLGGFVFVSRARFAQTRDWDAFVGLLEWKVMPSQPGATGRSSQSGPRPSG
jgi:hypothetical protein